jgi:hypothetical protein
MASCKIFALQFGSRGPAGGTAADTAGPPAAPARGQHYTRPVMNQSDHYVFIFKMEDKFTVINFVLW